MPCSDRGNKMIKVVLVDSHPIFRRGLRDIIDEDPELYTTGDTAKSGHAIELMKKTLPDVVVIDPDSGDTGGNTIMHEMRKSSQSPKFIFLTSEADTDELLDWIRDGVDGILPKDVSGPELIRAIKKVNQSKAVFCEHALEVLHDYSLNAQRGGLTRHETRIVCLIAQGLSNKRLAKELNISVRTVESHKRNIMQKLGVQNSLGIIRYAYDRGLNRKPVNSSETESFHCSNS